MVNKTFMPQTSVRSTVDVKDKGNILDVKSKVVPEINGEKTSVEDVNGSTDPNMNHQAVIVEEIAISEVFHSSEEYQVTSDATRIQKRSAELVQNDSKRVKSYTILFTGYRPPKSHLKILRELGATMVDSVEKANIVVMKHAARTEKFLVAIVKAIPIIQHSWVQHCITKKQLQPIDGFELVDEAYEKEHNFKLSTSLSRAKTTKLLHGHTVFVSEGVKPSHEIVARLATEAGANVYPVIKESTIQESILHMKSIQKYLFFTCYADIFVFPLLHDHGILAYSIELLLDGIQKQEIILHDPKYIIEDLSLGNGH
jgi:hypothetical protein